MRSRAWWEGRRGREGEGEGGGGEGGGGRGRGRGRERKGEGEGGGGRGREGRGREGEGGKGGGGREGEGEGREGRGREREGKGGGGRDGGGRDGGGEELMPSATDPSHVSSSSGHLPSNRVTYWHIPHCYSRDEILPRPLDPCYFLPIASDVERACMVLMVGGQKQKIEKRNSNPQNKKF